MIIKKYSDAHLDASRKVFPEKVDNSKWLNTQWTDEDINLVKSYEMKYFMDNPTQGNYPFRIEPNDGDIGDHTASLVDSYLLLNPQAKTILSVGCGGGDGIMAC